MTKKISTPTNPPNTAGASKWKRDHRQHGDGAQPVDVFAIGAISRID